MSPDMNDSFYHTGNRQPVASMLSEMEFADLATLGLLNRSGGFNTTFVFTSPPEIWLFPVKTFSRSEEGLDVIYQCSTILPHWRITLEPGKTWEMVITFK